MRDYQNPRNPHGSALRYGLAAAVALCASAQAALVVNESFGNYTNGALNGQAATGEGLTGNWASATVFQHQGTGLAMSGAYSAGGSVNYSGSNNTTYKISSSFASPLATGQLYGSYLFSSTVQSDARSVAAVAVGIDTDGDNTASFVWGSNGYYSPSAGNPAYEAPGVRTEGSGWATPTATAITAGETYLMMFSLNASTGATSAWVLNQGQLTNHLASSFDDAALNLADVGTDADDVVWRGSATTANPVGSMTHLHLLGLARSAGFSHTWDEFRVSDASLREAVTIPEPSTLALASVFGAFAFRRRRAA